MSYRFRTELWQHQGGSWHFVTLPEEQTDEIDELTASTSRGFGSVRVIVTIGTSTWRTSIFPDTKRGAFVLPIKKAVRTGEGLRVGEAVDVHLELEGS